MPKATQKDKQKTIIFSAVTVLVVSLMIVAGISLRRDTDLRSQARGNSPCRGKNCAADIVDDMKSSFLNPSRPVNSAGPVTMELVFGYHNNDSYQKDPRQKDYDTIYDSLTSKPKLVCDGKDSFVKYGEGISIRIPCEGNDICNPVTGKCEDKDPVSNPGSVIPNTPNTQAPTIPGNVKPITR